MPSHFEISHLPEETIGYFHSDFRIVVDYFVHRRMNPDYRPSDPVKFKHVDEVLKMLKAITQDDRFIEVLDGEGGKPKDMCEVLDRVEARGEEKGFDKAILESIRNIMKTLKLKPQEAMDALLIPAGDRAKYAAKL